MGAGVTLGGIGGELRLDRIPEGLSDDRRVFARMGLPLVHDLAAIEAVLQHQVKCTAREWLAANAATRSARPRLALDAAGFEVLVQQPDRTEFGIAAKHHAHDLRLTVDHDELVVLYPIPEWHHAAHPHPLHL